MFGRQETGAAPESRRRELEERGLGGFAELVVEVESHEPKNVNLAEGPVAQRPRSKVSPEAMAEFEALFIKPGADFSERTAGAVRKTPEPSGKSASKPRVSFADAFRIDGAGGQASRESDAESAPIVEEAPPRAPSSAQQGARRIGPSQEKKAERPARPRPEPRVGFDLGQFYDRIGLAREEAVALTRMLANQEASNEPPRSSADEIERLDGFLSALDIDLSEKPQQTDAGRSRQEADRKTHEADRKTQESELRLRELVAPLASGATRDERMLCATVDGRFALVLDKGLSAALARAAENIGAAPSALIEAALFQAASDMGPKAA